MNTLRLPLTLCAALALLAGCGGSQPPIGTPGVMPHTAAIGKHAARGKSWMLPEAKKIPKLLYISDGLNSVNVYNYKSRTLVGTLSGFDEAYGECVDKSGDIWITNYSSNKTSIAEYKHGGVKPIRSLPINEHSLGCAIDPVTGNLAVTNKSTELGTNGSVLIFKNASGTPAQYTAPDSCPNLWPPGYDNQGNLYVEAQYRATAGSVCELPAGGSALQPVSFDRTIDFPTSVMWDGKYLTLGDQSYHYKGLVTTVVYQVFPNASGGLTLLGTTILLTGCRHHRPTDVPFPYIVGRVNTPENQQQGSVLLGRTDSYCNPKENNVGFWRYPRGDHSFKSLKGGAVGIVGEAVSIEHAPH
jgi:hypothetical protein